MREWLVIESAYKHAVFAADDERERTGYIPRDVAEPLLGRDLGGTVWFTKEESAKMRYYGSNATSRLGQRSLPHAEEYSAW